MHIGLLGTFTTLWNHGSRNEDILGSLVRALKLLEAIQASWDHDRLIA